MTSNMNTKLDLHLPHGTVEGIYAYRPEIADPLVVITNGHNGFYNYGMFPYIQEHLLAAGISSYSYNFSHGGVKNGEDHFSDLNAYQENCMRLEQQDLIGILRSLGRSALPHPTRGVFLLSHSLGSVPTIFAIRDAFTEGISVQGAVLIAPLKTLRVFPEEMMTEWQRAGVFHLKNNRTAQMLPQGSEFLQEILESDGTWNIERALKSTHTTYLMVHGADDKDVPIEHSEFLVRWANDAGLDASTRIIPKAGHTFGTTHPFQGATPELEEMLTIVADWILARAAPAAELTAPN